MGIAGMKSYCLVLLLGCLAVSEAGSGSDEKHADVKSLAKADDAALKVADAAGKVEDGVQNFKNGLDENMHKTGHANLVELAKQVDTDAKNYNLIKLEKKASSLAESAVDANRDSKKAMKDAKADLKEQKVAQKETSDAAEAETALKKDLSRKAHANKLKHVGKMHKSDLPQWAQNDVARFSTIEDDMRAIGKGEESVAAKGQKLVEELGPMSSGDSPSGSI